MIKNYFLDGNTSLGYVSLIDNVINNIDKIYIVRGTIGKEKTNVFKSISKKFEQENLAVNWLHNPSNEDLLVGIVIPERSIAFLDGSHRSGFDGKYNGFVEDVFDFSEALDKADLQVHKKAIISLQREYEQLHEEAYKKFAKGKEIHEKKEELYISAMDFEKANKVTAQIASSLFDDLKVDTKQTTVEKLFFGASTPNGAVNYIDNITSDIKKRYIIKGRSGSGKSTLMRKIGHHAESIGLAVQYSPCGLDPNSLDMVVIPALSVAIIDGTAPHVIDATRPADEIIDMFLLCMDQSVEMKYDKEFEGLHAAYKQVVNEGTNLLKEAKTKANLLDEHFEAVLNKDIVLEKTSQILDQL